jgi:serine/threonine protein kinase
MNREQLMPVRSFKKNPKFYRKGPPFCLSNFVLIEELGRGVFGQVYNVYDKEKGYRVAMKVARPIHTAAIGHEIEVVTKLAGLDVRNIVELHGTGTCDLLDNRVFYAMRVEDGTLQSFIDNDNTLDGPSFFSLLFELVFTIKQFRENGFQHRDIKLDNILYRIESNIPREYKLDSGRKFIAEGLIQPIFADFNTGTFEPDPTSSDTVGLVNGVIVYLFDHITVNDAEEIKLQEVTDLITEDDGTVEALNRVLERIVDS